jgi:hypothetical protein
MHDGPTDKLVSESSRQQKIDDIVHAILPHFPRRDGSAPWYKALLVGTAVLCFITTGYMLAMNNRHISYSEKMTLQILIEHSARKQNITIQAVTRDLIRELMVDKVRNIRAYQWNQAIRLLNHYMD